MITHTCGKINMFSFFSISTKALAVMKSDAFNLIPIERKIPRNVDKNYWNGFRLTKQQVQVIITLSAK